jgi:phytanoyl-CoA dioxygenase PhyH
VNQTPLHNGWALLPKAIHAYEVAVMRRELDASRDVCTVFQCVNGIQNTEGTVHHLPAIPECRSFLRFLDNNPADDVIFAYFGGPYILNSMGGNFNEGQNYASEIHRDIRSFQDPCPMLNTLVMLDDFTADNGATWLMEGGHRIPTKPTDEEFWSSAVQITAPAGSILIWNSNLWHKAGENKTGKPRRIVTPIFSKPWFKQGMDYCRAIGEDKVAVLSEKLKQVLGYYSRIPANLDEWYQQPDRRFYRGDQG